MKHKVDFFHQEDFMWKRERSEMGGVLDLRTNQGSTHLHVERPLL